MPLTFKCFEDFKRARIAADRWRTLEDALSQLDSVEQEMTREVLRVPRIDNRTDRDYERRLYEGFRDGLDRLRGGRPLFERRRAAPRGEVFRPRGGFISRKTIEEEPPAAAIRPSIEIPRSDEEVSLTADIYSPRSTPSSLLSSPDSLLYRHNRFLDSPSRTPNSSPRSSSPPTPLGGGRRVKRRLDPDPLPEPAPPAKRRRSHQVKFDDDELKKIRKEPPRTRSRGTLSVKQ